MPTGTLEGKVAVITGAARGQGRSHAVRLAGEGADIVAIDICRQIDTVPYPLATPDDLAETATEVEKLDRRIVTREADVRDVAAVTDAIRAGIAELGRVDIVLPNAGIAPHSADESDPVAAFHDTVMTNLEGVRHTVQAAVPRMIEQGEGGAIVVTSSTQGLSGRGGNGSGAMEGYVAAKHGVVGLMRSWANWLAPHHIRVNTVHPTGVNTPMIDNDAMQAFLAQSPEVGAALTNLLDVEAIEPIDISNAIAWLVSDQARYVTGVTLPVDAGFMAK
ncbi:mycofactocin-coupled SDR family oxidoreductase [Pseudonocardia sp. KRD-184]|uniref:Mycofactocin-coupled SDR family oxidoreductase n=1 Tax=Pseudonocardia oceani TaxID=2792013 RepID=A0ABS6U7A9_9PSEU|nr:mycofactocin-coupled SDR family oxidoreductase [Pseudonocardia oceani]MBW0091059.1 mycofactocin-coupled SDR family oxidoreductase [Pseudonocardia oceani]MBW0097726.1 mycofactocin-coupled SDR family oxidoreductase [Pseudonocardia oceani]MBW0110248.1 mycofactocin-coupled SDR family oxidoreductase [Pseudonocardia oceani]MBW0122906.1 mycofactocin-coupled SDR family oxidoreductase [Pseudonocardia oceani]MBW0128112.1 mycofactocin-coupled SDR family oxidoreductase [Pseudonocardia oceani]